MLVMNEVKSSRLPTQKIASVLGLVQPGVRFTTKPGISDLTSQPKHFKFKA